MNNTDKNNDGPTLRLIVSTFPFAGASETRSRKVKVHIVPALRSSFTHHSHS